MKSPKSGYHADITELLQRLSGGDEDSREPLLALVYSELRGLARGYMSRERADHTLEPTALVHEAYLRLVDQERVQWNDRGHFLAVAAQAMRRILVDHSRRHRRHKRAGSRRRVPLEEGMRQTEPNVDLVALDETLGLLEEHDARKARVVELRYFAGLTRDETAEALGISRSTVEEDWRYARAWLRRNMNADAEGAEDRG